jgi:hypothetical protein
VEQIIFYVWGFVWAVVIVTDVAFDWLASHGISTWLFFTGVIGALIIHIINTWLIAMEQRIQSIEAKLGIQVAEPVENRQHTWLILLFWFLLWVYLFGKAVQAEEMLTFTVGIAFSVFMLLVCVVCAYSLIDQAVRDFWRKKRERRELLDKIFADDKSD